jgi:tetratricopeptide (TPR) repeat protein
VAIAGLGGVGKTALALVAGHRLVGEGRPFAGALFLNLHGYTPEARPLSPDQALDQLLRALGVSPDGLPDAVAEKEALYRSELVRFEEEAGRPLLLVADNAAEFDQVRPLAPGAGGSCLLVTSRKRLHLLEGARHLSLKALGREESVRVLVSSLTMADPQDPRAGREQDLARLADSCAGLPLALRIVGAMMVRSRRRSPGSLADRLEPGQRVGRLKDGRDSLETLFDLSLQELTPAQVEALFLLSVAPGADIATRSAAVLVGLEEDEAVEVLEELAAAHLINEDADRDRWFLHDLLAEHVGNRGHLVASGDEVLGASVVRLLEYYGDTTLQAAYRVADAALPPALTPRLPGREQAWAWLETELPNLVMAAHRAHAAGFWQISVILANGLEKYLVFKRFFEEHLTVQTIKREAAKVGQELPDTTDEERRKAVLAEMRAEAQIGETLVRFRRFEEAVPPLERALEFFGEHGDHGQQLTVLESLPWAFLGLFRLDRAREYFELALSLCREHGNGFSEALILTNFAALDLEEERVDEAITRLRRARSLFAQQDQPLALSHTLINLGHALERNGQVEEGVEALDEALRLCRVLGDRPKEARAALVLGSVLRDSERYDEAIAALEGALPVVREIEDDYLEALVREDLGGALTGAGRFEEARDHLQRSADLLRASRVPGAERSEARVRENLHSLRAVIRSLGGSDEDVPAHPGQQGQDDDEQHRPDEPGAAL